MKAGATKTAGMSVGLTFAKFGVNVHQLPSLTQVGPSLGAVWCRHAGSNVRYFFWSPRQERGVARVRRGTGSRIRAHEGNGCEIPRPLFRVLRANSRSSCLNRHIEGGEARTPGFCLT